MKILLTHTLAYLCYIADHPKYLVVYYQNIYSLPTLVTDWAQLGGSHPGFSMQSRTLAEAGTICKASSLTWQAIVLGGINKPRARRDGTPRASFSLFM